MLGIWQINRYTQKQQLHDTPSTNIRVIIADLVDAKNSEELIGKDIEISGDFIVDANFKHDNRMYNSTYGIDHYSLFKESTSNKVYLVNMGWLEVGNKRDRLLENYDFSGIHKLQAKIANIPSKPPFISPDNFRDEKQQDLWVFINKDFLQKHYDTTIENLILINLKPSDTLKYRTLEREDNSFMHILYAIQWFLFSLFALFGLSKIYKNE